MEYQPLPNRDTGLDCPSAGQHATGVNETTAYRVQHERGRLVKYSVKIGLRLAWTQIAIGVISIILIAAVVAMDRAIFLHLIGVLVCPSMYVVAGGLGIAASKSSGRRCQVIAAMVTSILAAVGALLGQLLVAVGGLIYSRVRSQFDSQRNPTHATIDLLLWSVLLTVAIAEGVIAIIQSALCCKGCCFAYTDSQQIVVTEGGLPLSCVQPNAPTVEMIRLPNGQTAVLLNTQGPQSAAVTGNTAK